MESAFPFPEVYREHTLRVLVVDDDSSLRSLMARLVESLGYMAVQAKEGGEALEIVRSSPVDSVVTDISMPGMMGSEFLRHLREFNLDIPVILVTGHPSLDSAIQAVEFGAFHYLLKPFAREEFKRVVKKSVDLHQIALLKRQALAVLHPGVGPLGDLAGLRARFNNAFSDIHLVFQPLCHIRKGTVYGYEALLRSTDPVLCTPDLLFSAAEYLHQVKELGRVVRAKAVAEAASRPESGFLFLNINPNELWEEDLTAPDSPLAALANRVVLEVTERAPLDQVAHLQERVQDLRSQGYRIAIDDLGAGYAGLNSFVALEPDIVKIDIGLVRGANADVVKQHLIRSMNQVFHDMGILVVAEGIETVEECQTLVELGCDFLQGFFLAKPEACFPIPIFPTQFREFQ